jgi:transcriptional regulator with XRE-family HTH domain
MANGTSDTGARVRELRDIAGFTPETIAARLGVSLAEYAGYESGATDIPISMLYELAGLFGVDMTDLMTGKSATLHDFAVVRAGKGLEVERYPGYRFESLAHAFRNRLIEPMIVTLDPDENRKMKLVTTPVRSSTWFWRAQYASSWVPNRSTSAPEIPYTSIPRFPTDSNASREGSAISDRDCPRGTRQRLISTLESGHAGTICQPRSL